MSRLVTEPDVERVPVRPLKLQVRCPACRSHNVESRGRQLLVHPPLYVHGCNDCGVEMHLRDVYPRIVYEESPA